MSGKTEIWNGDNISDFESEILYKFEESRAQLVKPFSSSFALDLTNDLGVLLQQSSRRRAPTGVIAPDPREKKEKEEEEKKVK